MGDQEAGYWPSRWPGEDGGPRRLQRPLGGAGPALAPGRVDVASRDAIAATMVVLRGPGEVFWGRPARPLKEYLRDLARLKHR